MLLTLTTTHKPATDLGYLLHKNPFRCQSAEMPFGVVHIFYPIATEEECRVAVLLDIDTVDLVRNRRRGKSSVSLDQYVNDRPYVCSSFLSVVLSRAFKQTLNGKCREKPELVTTPIPLVASLHVLPCRGGEGFLHRLFEPLGYKVESVRHPLDDKFPEWGESCYFTVTLSKTTTVKELFNHLYVLIPVLDNQKHYYVDESEIDKLLKCGEGWLPNHPDRNLIAKRYLKYRSSYAREALRRLIEDSPLAIGGEDEGEQCTEDVVEKKLNLNEERLGTVLAALKSSDAESVVDLGCGEGKLLRLLLKEKQFKKILGMDVSIRSLEIASERLRLQDLPPRQKERIDLLHGSLMYRDKRIEGFDAATVVEVIEHLDTPRLKAFERVLFEFARPRTIVLTTPNREFNVVWENVGSDNLRHKDHRFEWTRQEFESWANAIAEKYNYKTRFLFIGPKQDNIGTPTQMSIFTRED